MGCICNNLADRGAPPAATCIGHLWMFENLQPTERDALVAAARGNQFKRGQTIFMQGAPGIEMFLTVCRLT